MNEAQREQVLANARYLQQVRPIDPAEIHAYVEGRPDPSAVRTMLRDEALSLGFVERSDGTFVPAPAEPEWPDREPVGALPDQYDDRLDALLAAEFGPGWSEGESGDELRERIRDFKARYHRGAAVTYDYPTALAYAIYHLPQAYAATWSVLGALGADGLIPGRLRVLDVGAGVGGPALGVADLFADDGLVEYHAVEPSGAADVLTAMVAATGPNLHHRIHRAPIESFEPAGDYDLVLCSNVLSELADPVAVASRLVRALAADGTFVGIAPADRSTAIGLREIERALEDQVGVTVYAPTVRLWPGKRPESRSWSFDVWPSIAAPSVQRRLDRGGRATPEADDHPGSGEFENRDVQYAFTVLRPDGRRRLTYDPAPAALAPMAESESHVTERIDCVGIKLSHDLAGGDGNPLYLVGDGSQQTDHYAVLTRPSRLNRTLRTADYGELLRFEHTLVLWNEEEGAFNLVVDGETTVDRIPP